MRRLTGYLLLIPLLLIPGFAGALETENSAEIQAALEAGIDALDLSDWESSLDALPTSFRELLRLDSIRSFILNFGTKRADFEGIGDYLRGLCTALLNDALSRIWMLPCVALLSALFQALIDDKDLKKLLGLLCYGLCMANLIGLFAELIGQSKAVVENLSRLSQLSVPIAAALLTAAGSGVAGNLIGPSMGFLSGSMLKAMQSVVLPLICLCGMAAMLSRITERRELSQMDAFLRSLCKWIMGLCSTMYVGFMAVNGVAGSGLDTLALRTAKFTLDKSIPVMGGAVSGTVDIARACAIVIKNGAGIALVLLVLGYVLIPILRLIVTTLLLRLSAALCAPLSERKLPDMLGECAGVCGLLIAVLSVSALMLIITAAQIIGAGQNL